MGIRLADLGSQEMSGKIFPFLAGVLHQSGLMNLSRSSLYLILVRHMFSLWHSSLKMIYHFFFPFIYYGVLGIVQRSQEADHHKFCEILRQEPSSDFPC